MRAVEGVLLWQMVQRGAEAGLPAGASDKPYLVQGTDYLQAMTTDMDDIAKHPVLVRLLAPAPPATCYALARPRVRDAIAACLSRPLPDRAMRSPADTRCVVRVPQPPPCPPHLAAEQPAGHTHLGSATEPAPHAL
jgi:hypothetical protein